MPGSYMYLVVNRVAIRAIDQQFLIIYYLAAFFVSQNVLMRGVVNVLAMSIHLSVRIY